MTSTAVNPAPGTALDRESGRGSRRSVGRAALTVVGIVLLLIMIFPLYWMLNASFQPSGNTLNASFLPLHPTFDGYAQAIHDQGRNLVTSLIIACGTVVLTLLLATPAAYALASFRFRWVPIALLAILISQMIPGIVVANALYTAYERFGLLNSIPGLVLANATSSIPFAILIMRSFMLALPPSLVEAARVDGAGLVRSFLSIVVPISRNSLITAGLFTFLFAWGDFLLALTLTTTDQVRPVTLGIYQYLGANVSRWNAVMATSVLAAIPAVVLLVVAQKYIAAGALGGSVK